MGSIYLEIVSDAALLETSRIRILDGEVPTTEDLVAHIHTVMFPQHPGVFVAHDGPVTQGFNERLEHPLLQLMLVEPDLRTTKMMLSRRMLRIPAKYSRGMFKQGKSRDPRP